MIMKHFILALLAIATLAACEKLPDRSYSLPVRPESLLDSSGERTSFSLASQRSVQDLTDWINKDQPTRAELSCVSEQPSCKKAIQVLASFAVPYKLVSAVPGDGKVVLIYSRIVTRNCNNHFVSNEHNVFNLNTPSFGCSVASNSIKMISDPQQVVNPLISGQTDAATVVARLKALQK